MIGKTISYYKIREELGKVTYASREAEKAKPLSITRNSLTSGRMLTLVLLRWRMPIRGWLG